MDLAEDFLTLRGQSYSYKVPYTQISRLFLLPRPGQTSISFVISVDPPIRQGKTGYQHLITQFPAEHETTVTLNLSADEISAKYPGKLEKEMTGATYEVLTKVFKVLTKKRMSIPKGFKSARGDSCVRCAVGNQEGLLYVLEKSFMFVNKPAMHLRFDDIEHVDLDRTSEGVNRRALKSWDLIVAHKNGTLHTFSNVDKGDYEPLVQFLKIQKVKLIGAQDPQEQSVADVMDDGDDDDDEESEDEDFDGGAPQSSSEEDSDDDDDDEGDDEGDNEAAAKPKKKAKRKAPDGASPKRQAKLKYGTCDLAESRLAHTTVVDYTIPHTVTGFLFSLADRVYTSSKALPFRAIAPGFSR
jgi:structure-specific recognition protein 1